MCARVHLLPLCCNPEKPRVQTCLKCMSLKVAQSTWLPPLALPSCGVATAPDVAVPHPYLMVTFIHLPSFAPSDQGPASCQESDHSKQALAEARGSQPAEAVSEVCCGPYGSSLGSSAPGLWMSPSCCPPGSCILPCSLFIGSPKIGTL